MANYLLSMQFDSSGCTDKRVINLGGVSFNHMTSLGRAAYFQPYNMQAGFYIKNSRIKEVIENGTWSIYFKYKVKEKDLLDSTPIIVYEGKNVYHDFLTIDNKNSFNIHFSTVSYSVKDIEYTFDNEWHTFYAYFKDDTLKFFIDGYLYAVHEETVLPEFTESFYIGVKYSSLEASNFCGYLNDFNIFEGTVYTTNFIPPTNYIYPSDVMTNYKNKKYTTRDDFESDLIDSIEHNREHSADNLIEFQKGYTPRILKLTWYQIDDGYFKNTEYKFNTVRDRDEGIYINITGIDTSLLTKDDRYFSHNLETALALKKIHPLMIFINKRFVRLSRIKLVKSDEWYTLFIKGMDKSTIVKTLDIILLPFAVIYEEDYGERADHTPLYVFNDEGLFSPIQSGSSYYYIDEEVNPYIEQIGIREYYAYEPKPKFMRFVWRYGKLETERITDTNGAYMVFRSDEYGSIRPGDKVLLYTGTTLINPEFYNVVGYDLIYFENLDDVTLLEGRTVTMQIITDLQNPSSFIYQDFSDIKIIDVEATQNRQSVFKIPEVVDKDGIEYRKFLVFKGHVLMEDQNRYTIDYDTKELHLLHSKDYITIGRHLTFLFVKVNKVDAGGVLHTKPIFYYTKPKDRYSADIPVPDGIEVYKHNSIVFKNSTLLSPYRYSINNNTITMNNEDDILDENCNLIVVMLELTHILDDPVTWREKMIKEEISKGNRYILYDLGISKKIKITTNNLLCFDSQGLVITNLQGFIYNYNIIKYIRTTTPLETQPTYLTCVYKNDLLANETNLNRFKNESFLRDYIKGKEEFYEMDSLFDQLMEDFELNHNRDLTYGENLSNSLDYIVAYNQNKIDDVYEKSATAYIKNYDGVKFNEALKKTDNGYLISIPRDEYKSNVNRTYPIFFQNGLLPDWIVREKANNTLVVLPNKTPATDTIKSINFKGLSNFLYPLNTILKVSKEVNQYITCQIRIESDNKIELDLYSAIMVIEKYGRDILTCRIEVTDIIEPEPYHRHVNQDILECSISVSNTLGVDIVNCRIEVPIIYEGTEADITKYTNSYDFFSKIEVLD